MWALSTCGELEEIKKNTHPKNITTLLRAQADGGICKAYARSDDLGLTWTTAETYVQFIFYLFCAHVCATGCD